MIDRWARSSRRLRRRCVRSRVRELHPDRLSSITQPSPGEAPATRTSPPTFTHAPSAPVARSASITRSAASPLPIPPGSTPTPAGRRTVPEVGSTSMPSHPRRNDEVAIARGRVGDFAERSVVTGAHHVAEDCGVEATVGDTPTLDAEFDQRDGRSRDDERHACARVQPADLTRTLEAAPARLELTQVRARTPRRARLRRRRS